MWNEDTFNTNTVISVINPLEPPVEGRVNMAGDVIQCFHDRRWATVLNESYGFKPYYFKSVNNGVRSGMLPLMTTSYPFGLHKRGVSLPFTDFCEPWAADKSGFEQLFQAAVKLGKSKGWRYLDLRGGAEWLPLESRSNSFFGHVLNIDKDDKLLLDAMKDSTRRNIRNAQRHNLRYSSEHSWEAMHAFYLLHCRTRKKHGVPPQPVRFFRLLHHHIIHKETGFVALVRYNDRIIAAAVFLLYGKHAIFKFGASDERQLHTRANDFVMWESIKKCRSLGVQQLYFGRTEPENLGLRRFKLGFGAREYPISYYRYDINAMKFCTRKHTKNITGRPFSWMPLFLLRLVGETVYPFVG